MEKTEHQQRVEQFMHLAGQEMPNKPTEPSIEVRILRAKLIFEEAVQELIRQGLGVEISVQVNHLQSGAYKPFDYNITGLKSSMFSFTVSDDFKFNMEETIDGCIDTSVVTIGTLSAIGVPDKPFLEEVDNNNLAKFGPGGHRNEDGKWIKPPGHKPPDIADLLRRLEEGFPFPEECKQMTQEEIPLDGPENAFREEEENVNVFFVSDPSHAQIIFNFDLNNSDHFNLFDKIRKQTYGVQCFHDLHNAMEQHRSVFIESLPPTKV